MSNVLPQQVRRSTVPDDAMFQYSKGGRFAHLAEANRGPRERPAAYGPDRDAAIDRVFAEKDKFKRTGGGDGVRAAARKLIAYLDDNGELRPQSSDPGWDLLADLRAALEAESNA